MKETLLFKLDKYINSYINEKKILNYSINTINTYSSILESFYEYMTRYEDKMLVDEVNNKIILEYVNSESKLSISTKQLRLTVLKTFFKYIDKNYSNYNFVDDLSEITIKKPKKEIESLNPYEVENLLAIFNKPNSISYNYNRDKLIITIFLFTGVRVSELLNIKFTDIQKLDNDDIYKILINGKGSKQRYIYIKEDKIVKEFNFIKQNNSTQLLFTTNRFKPLSRVGIYNIVTNKLRKAKIDKKGVHILRHTFAKTLVSKNINLSTIKDLLGHENIATTMIYAKSDESNKIGAIGVL